MQSAKKTGNLVCEKKSPIAVKFDRKINQSEVYKLTIFQRTVKVVVTDTKNMCYYIFFVKITGNGNKYSFLTTI